MFTRLLMLVLLIGACFAAPQTVSVDASASVSAPDGSVPDVPIPDVSAPSGTLPDVTPPPVSIPDVSAPSGTLPDVSAPSGTLPDVTPPSVSSYQDCVAALQAQGYTELANLFQRCPLSTLVPPGTNVTIPGIPNANVTATMNKFKDMFGKVNLSKIVNFLKSIIIKDIQFKAQLAQAAVGAFQNLVNQAQNIQGYPTGGVVWNGGNLVKPDISFPGGLIQGLDNFAQKGTQSLGQLLGSVGGALGGVVANVLNLLKGVLTPVSALLNDILNSVVGSGNTIILPTAAELTTLLANNLSNLQNLPNVIKQLTVPGSLTIADIIQQIQSGANSITTIAGTQIPMSSNSAHSCTIGGTTYTTSSAFSLGSGGTVIQPTVN